MNAPQQLVDFVDRLIEEKKYTDLTPEVRAQMREDLLTRLNDTLNARVIAELGEEDLKAFGALLDRDASPEEVQAFTSSKLPDPANFVANVLFDFRRTYLGLE